jgi:hypothetical protein
MTLQHSPGPWTIANDADGWDNIMDADGRKIAEVDSCSGGKDPDARLMAEAPHMLQLLREIVGAICTADDANAADFARYEARDLIRRLDGEA